MMVQVKHEDKWIASSIPVRKLSASSTDGGGTAFSFPSPFFNI
jgi:hypothetical protein